MLFKARGFRVFLILYNCASLSKPQDVQVDEDAGNLAEAVKLDLNTIFSGIRFQKIVELGLAGAQPVDTVSSKPHLMM